MRTLRIAAFAIVWLVATLSVPYSYFLGGSAGLAWAQTDVYVKCNIAGLECISFGEYEQLTPAQREKCGEDGNLYEKGCQKPYSAPAPTGTPTPPRSIGVLPRSNPDTYYMCKDQIGQNEYVISCRLGRQCSIRPTEYKEYGKTENDLSTCIDDIHTEAQSKKTAGHLVNPDPFQTATTYRIIEVTVNDCNTKCSGENLAGGAEASGGECSDTAPASGGLVVYKAISVACPLSITGKVQRCYCVGVNPQQLLRTGEQVTQTRVGAAPIASIASKTSCLAGTGSLVDDPEQIEEPKRFAANDVDCSLPTKVTINASMSATAVPVGSTVTVNGEVAKFSDACKGVSYACRLQYQKGCRVEQGFLRTCVVYNSCNLGDKVIMQQGAQCSWNWFQIIGLVLLAVSVFSAFKEPAQKTLGTGTPAAQTTSTLTTRLESIFGKNIGGFALQLMQKNPQVYVPDGCNSICGRNTGKTPISAAPACNGCPIEQKEGHYRCRLTACGGFENKAVTIEVRDASNRIVRTDVTTTDATGFYSFSFPAPSPAGSYTVTVSTDDPEVSAEIANITSLSTAR